MRMFGRMLASAPVPTVRKFDASEAVYRLGDMGHVVRPGLDQRRLPSLRAVSFEGADPSKMRSGYPMPRTPLPARYSVACALELESLLARYRPWPTPLPRRLPKPP
jgi:hypothetical protein